MSTPTQRRLARLDLEASRASVNEAALEREKATLSRANPLVQIAAWNVVIADMRQAMFAKAAVLRALLLEPEEPDP